MLSTIKKFIEILGLIFMFSLGVGSAWAQGRNIYVRNTYPGRNAYYPGYGGPVLIYPQPTLIFERRGSNDYLYEYDNIYGPEASAAGRMSHTVVSPPPAYYIRNY